jgi:AraC-like DNA-binding protein
MSTEAASEIVPSTIVVFAPRERVRTMIKNAFPRRRSRIILARTAADFSAAFRAELIDAALVDLSSGHEDTAAIAALSRDFPGSPFFGVAAMLGSDGPLVAQAASLDFADVLVDGVDDASARELVTRRGFSARFTAALRLPPEALALATDVQVRAWEYVVAHAGRRVQTDALAKHLGVTREHLSRTFAADGAPNLKRVIDLVRLLAAAELSKNPGYDIRDVATVLDFASSSHLSSTAQRVVGIKPASLARLRSVDLILRFTRGHGRSRN